MRIWKVPNIINNKMTQIAKCFSAIILKANALNSQNIPHKLIYWIKSNDAFYLLPLRITPSWMFLWVTEKGCLNYRDRTKSGVAIIDSDKLDFKRKSEEINNATLQQLR